MKKPYLKESYNFALRKYIFLKFILILCLSCQQDSKPIKFLNKGNHAVRCVISPRELPQSLHPTFEILIPAFELIHHTLTKSNHKGEQEAILLNALPSFSEDGKRGVYELRDDIVWPNGSPLTLDDIHFSIKLTTSPLLSHPALWSYAENILDFQSDPSSTQRFSLGFQPYISNRYISDYLLILSEDSLDPEHILRSYNIAQLKESEALAQDSVFQNWLNEFSSIGTFKEGVEASKLMTMGLGPYALSEWIPQERMVLERKDTYWMKGKASSPYHKRKPRIVSYLVDDPVQALRNKRAEVSWGLNPSAYSLLANEMKEDFSMDIHPGNNYAFIGLNLKPDPIRQRPFFVDKRIRQALAHLVPISEIIAQRYGDSTLAFPISGPVSPELQEFDPSISPRKYDPEKARILLDEANCLDRDGDGIREILVGDRAIPFAFNLLFKSPNPTYETIAKFTESACLKVGVKCQLQPVTREVFNKLVGERNFDAAIQAYTFQRPIVDYKQVWHSASHQKGGFNISGFGSPVSDTLIERIRRETNREKQIVYSRQLQHIIYDEQPVIFLFSPMRGIALHKKFQPGKIHYAYPEIYLNELGEPQQATDLSEQTQAN